MAGTTIMLGGHIFACSVGSKLHQPLIGPGRAFRLVGVKPEQSCFEDRGSNPILDSRGTLINDKLKQ